MGVLDRLRKKEEKKVDTETTNTPTELEKFLGEDKKTFEELAHAMFLDPRKISISMKDAADLAKKYEKANDLVRARAMYEIAGGLAVYEGNAKKAVEYFSECQRLRPDLKYPITKNTEKAIEKAQEYYKKYLK